MLKLKRALVAIPPALLVGTAVAHATGPLTGFVVCVFTYLATSALARALFTRTKP